MAGWPYKYRNKMNLKWSKLGFAGTIFHGAHHYINKKSARKNVRFFGLLF